MTAKFGTISRGTLRTEDLIEAFVAELEWLTSGGRAERTTEETALLVDAGEWLKAIGDTESELDHSELGGELVNELIDALSYHAPDYGYFGTLEGDGTEFGFWLASDFQRCFHENGGLEVSDTSEVPSDYSGEVLHVNDHGNATLYSAQNGQLTEVWSVV